jgi:hypothetical protein
LNAFNGMNNVVKIDKCNIPQIQETSEKILPTTDTMEHKGDTSEKEGFKEFVGMQERITRVMKALQYNMYVSYACRGMVFWWGCSCGLGSDVMMVGGSEGQGTDYDTNVRFERW